MLEPCERIYGGSELLQELPPVTHVRQAIYLPRTIPHECALFYPSGRSVAESLDYIGIPEPHLPPGLGHTPHSRHQFQKAPTGYRYIYIHNVSHHFGHFLIGALSRLWTLPLAQRRNVRLVFNEQTSVDALFQHDFTRTVWAALGLTRDNFVIYPEGIIFDEIEVPGASFEQNSHVHQVYSDVMSHIGHVLYPDAPMTRRKRMTYLTKQRLGSGIWRMRDEHVLTAKLSSLGFDIIAPEALSLKQQVALWKEGGVFVATSGSSLHTSAFAPGSKLISINNVPEMWSNQVLIDKVSGNDARYVYDKETFENVSTGAPFAAELVIHDMDGLAHGLLDMARTMQDG